MTQLEAIIESLRRLGGQGKYSDIYAEYERVLGTTLTIGRKAGIRRAIENHSSDSCNFKHKGDYFFSVHGIGNGTWGLRKNN